MRKLLMALSAGLAVASVAHAKLPPPPAKSDAEKAAEAEKAGASNSRAAAYRCRSISPP